MKASLENLSKLAGEKKAETKKYFAKLRKKSPKRLDLIMQELHDNEFAVTDCLTCANCCKTTSPIFTDKDVARISKNLRMKEHQFISTYLKGRFEMANQGTIFLDEVDNTCTIYDVRPKACSEYPHTNRKKFIQLTNLTLKNTEVCPAALNIVEALKKKLPL